MTVARKDGQQLGRIDLRADRTVGGYAGGGGMTDQGPAMLDNSKRRGSPILG